MCVGVAVACCLGGAEGRKKGGCECQMVGYPVGQSGRIRVVKGGDSAPIRQLELHKVAISEVLLPDDAFGAGRRWGLEGETTEGGGEGSPPRGG